jgi:hypothetical protein
MNLATLTRSALVAAICGASLIHAGTIVYTETATASGSLGSSIFSNALLTITLTGDTANVTGASGFFTNTVGTATVNVSGIGLATFTSALDAFDNQTFTPTAAAGIGEVGSGSILDTFDSAFTSYALQTAIGPITDASFVNSSVSASTSLGALNLTSAGNSTFTATTGVPEPAGFALLGIGAASLCTYKRLRGRAKA